MKVKKLCALIAFSQLLFSCKAENSFKETKLEGESYFYKDGELTSKFNLCDSSMQTKQFTVFHNFRFTDNYVIKDSVYSDINNDKVKDWILVLSPAIQEDDSFAHPCYYSKYNKRLLVVALSKNGKSDLIVNEHAILNKAESQSEPFRKIDLDKNGFTIKYYLGSTLRCYFDFSFTKNDDDFYLHSLRRECYLIDLSKSDTLYQKYAVADSLNLNKIDARKFINFPALK